MNKEIIIGKVRIIEVKELLNRRITTEEKIVINEKRVNSSVKQYCCHY